MPHIAPWFPAAKFGVFIHWTLKNGEMDLDAPLDSISLELQREWAKEKFTAENFDARQWAKLFKSWGAKYAVLTTKHHIGFALYDAPGAPFTATNSSPAGRDLVDEFVQALRDEGLKVGLYFSLPDWSHPDYASLAGGDDPRKYAKKDDPERWQRFTDQMFAEVEHLCTAYGKIDLLWFDGDWERSAEQWRSVELAGKIEQWQPGIVINNRLRHACIGHYGTPESNYPIAPRQGFNEMCTTPGANWDGLAANDILTLPNEMVRLFGDVMGLGWNLLLNVAPAFDGTIPQVQVDAMAGLGEWITAHAEAIYGSEAGLPAGLFNGASTHRDSVLYLIAYDQPRTELVVKGLTSNVKRITQLVTGKELRYRWHGGRAKFGQSGWLFIDLPEDLVEPIATVVKIELEDDLCKLATPTGETLVWKGKPPLDEQSVYEARDV